MLMYDKNSRNAVKWLPSMVANSTTEGISRASRQSSNWHPNSFTPVSSFH